MSRNLKYMNTKEFSYQERLRQKHYIKRDIYFAKMIYDQTLHDHRVTGQEEKKT